MEKIHQAKLSEAHKAKAAKKVEKNPVHQAKLSEARNAKAAKKEEKNPVMNLGPIMYLENAFFLNLEPVVSINSAHNKLQILRRNKATNLKTAMDWIITRSVDGFKDVSPENFKSMDVITHEMERMSVNLFAASLNLGIHKIHDISAELALLLVDSGVGKDMTGYEFIRRIKTAAPTLSQLPFGILSINFAPCVKRAASPKPHILMVCDQPMLLTSAKSLFVRFYKGNKSSHTFHKQRTAIAALNFLNEQAVIVPQIKLLVIDIDQLGGDMETFKQFQEILNKNEAVIVVTVPVVMEEQFPILKNLFEQNVMMMITSAPLHDSLIPYLSALM